MDGLKARFDWYECTFESLDPVGVAKLIAARLDAEISETKGRNGYSRCTVVHRQDRVLARVLHHSKRAAELHIEVTGESCDDVVPVIRELWPDHRVSRCDVAVDFEASFEELDKVLLDFAEERNLKHRLFSDSDGGSTRYLGARSSEVQVRVYKKTEELRARYPHQAHEVPDGIVRVELVARPNSKIKAKLAQMQAGDMFGLSKWGKAFAAQFLQIDAERVPTHFREVTDWSRLLGHLGQQYGPAIQRRAQEVGMSKARAEVLEAVGIEGEWV